MVHKSQVSGYVHPEGCLNMLRALLLSGHKASEKLHPFLGLLALFSVLMLKLHGPFLNPLRGGVMRNLHNQVWELFFHHLPHNVVSLMNCFQPQSTVKRSTEYASPLCEEWKNGDRVAPGGVSSISCLRAQPEPGSGSLTHVLTNRLCGQL